jgi:hypothetical protein
MIDWRAGAGGAEVYLMSSGFSPEAACATLEKVSKTIAVLINAIAKLKHWSAFRAKNAPNASPILEFVNREQFERLNHTGA